MKLENLKIVLVGTTHPGNIGAAARAMHNMCLQRLCLVEPQCPVGEIAYARASGANLVLDRRQTCDSLEQAVAECGLVIATSARRRALAWPEISIEQLVEKLHALDDATQAALVFGREHSGLTNDEVQLSNCMVSIPCNPEFSSLNLAAAVQILCFEIYRHRSAPASEKKSSPRDRPASSDELERYFAHLQQVLEHCGFLDPERPGQIMQRLRRLYLRSELTQNEINILRGVLSTIEQPE